MDRVDLLNDAFKINGVYPEDVISGYISYKAVGRESLNKTLNLRDNVGDGETIITTKYPKRVITVSYYIHANSLASLREKAASLQALMDAEDAEIIFNDDPNCYYIATPVTSTSIQDYKNSLTGVIELVCTDPHKYSKTLKEVTASVVDGIMQATINNTGSVPVPISYEITNNHDNGYVGIISDRGVLQIGKIDEIDGYNYAENERLMTQNNLTSAPDDTSGTDAANTTYDNHGSMRTQSYSSQYGGASYTYLTMGTPGSKTSVPNGGMRTVTVPADSQGVYGCKNFEARVIAAFEAYPFNQSGEMNINFLTGSNGLIFSLKWIKNDGEGSNFRYQVIGNDKQVLKDEKMTMPIQPFVRGAGYLIIRKEGSKIKIGIATNGRAINAGAVGAAFDVPAIENMECRKVQVACRRMNAGGSGTLSYFGFAGFQFFKVGVEKYRDIPNRYAEDDIIYIDGDNANIYVNGVCQSEDIIVGSTFFKAPPGGSIVQFAYSDFSTPAPTIKAYIREAWI